MNRGLLVALAATTAFAAASQASAAVVVCTGANCVNTDENVLLTAATNADPVFGVTNNTKQGVTFTSASDQLNADASGQAMISATDLTLNGLQFTLDGGATFSTALFNLFPLSGNVTGATGVTFTFLGANGTIGTSSQTLGSNGQNFFGVSTTAGERLTGVSFTTANGGIQDFRQLRLGGVQPMMAAVPEPSTWAMMLIGFGAIGASARRRHKVTTTAKFA